MLKWNSVALGQPPFVRGTGVTFDLDGEIRENICVLGRGLSSDVIILTHKENYIVCYIPRRLRNWSLAVWAPDASSQVHRLLQ